MNNIFQYFNTNGFVVGYGPRGIITIGDRMDEIIKASEIEKEVTIQERISNGIAVLLNELVREGEAKIVATLWSSDDGDVCIVQYRDKQYGVFWIGNSSDWYVTTPKQAEATVQEWQEIEGTAAIEVPWEVKYKGMQVIEKYKPSDAEEAIELLIREMGVTEQVAEEIYYSWKNIYPTGKSWE